MQISNLQKKKSGTESLSNLLKIIQKVSVLVRIALALKQITPKMLVLNTIEIPL